MWSPLQCCPVVKCELIQGLLLKLMSRPLKQAILALIPSTFGQGIEQNSYMHFEDFLALWSERLPWPNTSTQGGATIDSHLADLSTKCFQVAPFTWQILYIPARCWRYIELKDEQLLQVWQEWRTSCCPYNFFASIELFIIHYLLALLTFVSKLRLSLFPSFKIPPLDE